MKKLITLIFGFIFLISCSQQSNREKLLNIYTELLIARESIADSLEANKQVLTVLKKNGYTELQFRQEIFNLAKTEKNFMSTIDSIRNFAKFEQKRIQDSLDEKYKQQNKSK